MLGRRRVMDFRGLDGTLERAFIRRDGLEMIADDDKDMEPRRLELRDGTSSCQQVSTSVRHVLPPRGGIVQSSSLSAGSREGESTKVSK